MSDKQDKLLLAQLNVIAEGLGETFAPFCEVVVHDLKNPDHAILAIHNNLSGRGVGEPATELGLARISSPDFPSVISNYANHFSDGRPAKSTSVGIKNDKGEYVAALCLNVDLTLFSGMLNALVQFTALKDQAISEHIQPTGTDAIRKRIDQFAARHATTPRALKMSQRKMLVQELKQSGLLDVKKAIETVAQHLGVSRATAYIYVKDCL